MGMAGTDVLLTEWLGTLTQEGASPVHEAFEAARLHGVRFDLEFPGPDLVRW